MRGGRVRQKRGEVVKEMELPWKKKKKNVLPISLFAGRRLGGKMTPKPLHDERRPLEGRLSLTRIGTFLRRGKKGRRNLDVKVEISLEKEMQRRRIRGWRCDGDRRPEC